MIGMGSAAMLPKFPKLDTEAALYKFSRYTLSVELNLLSVLPSSGIKTTGILNLLESVNFGTKRKSDAFRAFSAGWMYKFSTDLALVVF